MHQVGQSDCLGKLQIEMHVVAHPASTEELAALSLGHATQVGEEPSSPLRIEPGPTMPGSPDEVDADRRKRGGHEGRSIVGHLPETCTVIVRGGADSLRSSLCFPPTL